MTPKQKLKSIEKKMERLQERNPDIDLKVVNRYFGDIERYSKLQKEGKDIYTIEAASHFKVSEQEVTKEQRNEAKLQIYLKSLKL